MIARLGVWVCSDMCCCLYLCCRCVQMCKPLQCRAGKRDFQSKSQREKQRERDLTLSLSDSLWLSLTHSDSLSLRIFSQSPCSAHSVAGVLKYFILVWSSALIMWMGGCTLRFLSGNGMPSQMGAGCRMEQLLLQPCLLFTWTEPNYSQRQKKT